jgi:tRNA A-37 threonylcarbamoyl transferase component Bud32
MTPDPDLLARAAHTQGRVSRLEHDGRAVWVKREEQLSLRMRLQKGGSASAFERERRALHRLAPLGLPAPRILAEGSGFFVIEDAGVSLLTMVRHDLGRDGERRAAFAAAGEGLAAFHEKHLSHGNPRLKDICWADGRITFIDYEKFDDRRNTPAGHARDVATFVLNAIAEAGAATPDLDVARDAYRARDAQGVWDGAARLVRRLRYLDWLTKPLQYRGPGRSREFKAIPLTMAYFAAS